MEILFRGKRALVTGAGKGIGRLLAMKLNECGAEVVAVSRTQSDLQTLKKDSRKIETVCLDVGNWELTKNALQNVGPIDLLVNNAGIAKKQSFGELTEEICDNYFDINVKPIVNISQIIAQDMKTRGKGGAIVNVSSVLGFLAITDLAIYSASKGAMDQLTRSMAVEFGPFNIRVNSVNPGTVRTLIAEKAGFLDEGSEIVQTIIKRTPLGRLSDPEDIVNPIMFLLSDKASMVTGIIFPVDGGLSANFA